MKKISNFIKIVLALVIAVTAIRMNSVQASETYEVGHDDRIQITPYESPTERTVNITKDMFELTYTDWMYAWYVDGELFEIGVIDNNFQGIALDNANNVLMCTPKEGVANFYGASLANLADVYVETLIPAVCCMEIDIYREYDIYNGEEQMVYIYVEGDCKFDYTIMDSSGEEIENKTNASLPTQLSTYNRLIFTPSSQDKECAGLVYYNTTMSASGAVDGSESVLKEYYTFTTHEYAADGTIYYITNTYDCGVYVTIGGIESFSFSTYYENGKECESGDILLGQTTEYFIPRGGKLELTYDESQGGTFSMKNYSVYDKYIQYNVVKVPGDTISESGTYRLETGVKYTFGNGNWNVNDDTTTYNGGVSFYVEKAGDYKLTLQ